MNYDYMGLFTGGLDPALAATLINNPEAVGPALAQRGVAPPTLPTPAAPAAPAAPPMSPASQAVDWLSGQFGTPMQRSVRPPGGGTAVPLALRPSPIDPLGGPGPSYGPSMDQLTQPVFEGPMPPNGVLPPNAQPTAGGRGISYTGAGAPREGTPDAMPPQAAQQGDLLKQLQGIKAPAPPEAQRVSTPWPMRPNQLPANNNLVQLLAAAMGNSPDVKQLLLANVLGGGRVR